MAQKKSNATNANQIPDIPAEISWNNQSAQKPKYRGATMIANNLQHGAINFGNVGGSGQGFAKNASHEAVNLSDISGGAIDISFSSGMSGIKSSYPSMEPINFKQSAPIIQVQVLPKESDNDSLKQKESEHAPMYDGFQPHNAHRSASMNPLQMQKTVDSILKILAADGSVDFYQKAPFAYVGRAFATHTDCEFMLNIYSDDTSESVVEIRRSSGECFEYGNVEHSILKQLTANGAIAQSDDDSEVEEDSFSSFGFGFGSLPPLDSLEFDSNFSGDTDVENDDQKKDANDEMSAEVAAQIVAEAVDLTCLRDVLRSNIFYLNECMAKDEDLFVAVPDIVSRLLNAASSSIFDCWMIKSYLGMISKLVSCRADIPLSLSSSIVALKSKWSNVVKNEVAKGVVFEFFPSQQIVRNCNQIIGQL